MILASIIVLRSIIWITMENVARSVIWNTKTSKIVRKYELPHKVVDCIEWCPNAAYCLLAVTNEE